MDSLCVFLQTKAETELEKSENAEKVRLLEASLEVELAGVRKTLHSQLAEERSLTETIRRDKANLIQANSKLVTKFETSLLGN